MSGTELGLTVFLAVLAAVMYLTPVFVDARTAKDLDDDKKIGAYAKVIRARRSAAAGEQKTGIERVRHLAAVPAAASVVVFAVALLNGPPAG